MPTWGRSVVNLVAAPIDGGFRVTVTWRYVGEVTWRKTTAGGADAPVTAVRDYTEDQVTNMTAEELANFRRVWGCS